MSGDRYTLEYRDMAMVITSPDGVRADFSGAHLRGFLAQQSRDIESLRSELAAAVAERDTLRAYKAKVEAAPVVADDAACARVSAAYYNDVLVDRDDAHLGREMIAAVRAELGPALGLVSREEMAQVVEAAYREGGFAGREGGQFNYRWATSNARKWVNGDCGGFVMWPKGGEG